MADRRAQYEELLKRAGAASALASWMDGTAGGAKGSTHEGNLWAAARLLANGLSHFLNHLIIAMIENLDGEETAKGAQEALDLVPENRAANAGDLRKIMENFFTGERMERDDTGHRTPPEPTPQSEPATAPAQVATPPADPAAAATEKKPAKGKKAKKGETPTEPAPVESAPPARSAPPVKTGDSSEAALIIAGLVRLGRFTAEKPLPVDVVRAWSSEERGAALAYIADQESGGQAPPPEILTNRFLEELDLALEFDQNEVLTAAGIAFAAEISLETQEDFDRLLAWAVARVRFMRGESLDVPAFPRDLVFLSDGAIFKDIHAEVVKGGDRGVAERIVEEKFEPNPAYRIALEILESNGEILSADGSLLAVAPALEKPLAAYLAEADTLGGFTIAAAEEAEVLADPLAEGERLAAQELARRAQEGDAAGEEGESTEAELEARRNAIRAENGIEPAEPTA